MSQQVPAKIAKPTRQRLEGRNYWYSIMVTKRCLDVKFSTIADWMGITTSNLTSMISQHLNPYPEQWRAFKEGVKCHNEDTDLRILMGVDTHKIKDCACGCGKVFLLGSPCTRKWFDKNKCSKRR